MMVGIHVFTSFTYSYLSRARVLAKSVRRRHPDWRLWGILVDAPPAGADDAVWRGEFDDILDAAVLFPGVWPRWIFKHDVVEACTAVKGHALLHIMSQGAEKIIYLDPDIAVFHDLQDVADRLDDCNVILTPHQIDSNLTERDIEENELASMRHGIYNLGFLAVRNSEEGRRMARWWSARLYHACYDDVVNGIFTDQKYCDLVPSLFSGVYIERDPGYNVASWNLSRRVVEITRSGDVLVNGSLLRFYHFTKINSAGDFMTEQYGGDQLAVFEIWNWYKRAIREAEQAGIPDKYWRYAVFDDGTPIPRDARLLYRSSADLMSRFPEPFSTGPGTFLEWFRLRGRDESQSSRVVLPAHDARQAGHPPKPAELAVIVHAFYPELFVEIRDLLAGYSGALKLFVTTTREGHEILERELEGFPFPFELGVAQNRGRDVLPFLRILPRVLKEGYEYVLKLHTKRSTHLSVGAAWRRELLVSLADAAELSWTIERLRRRPDVGIVGPSSHVIDMAAYWGSNEGRVRELAERMGVGRIEPRPNAFVAGTMFVARRQALEALASLGLSDEDFEVEGGQTDGTLAHAVERALTFSAAAQGLRVASKPVNAAGSDADLRFESALEYRFAPRSDCVRVDPERSVMEVEHIVRKAPTNLADKDVCIFVTYAGNGKVREHVISYIEALRLCNLKIVTVIVTDKVECEPPDAIAKTEGILVRANHGWDFAAWSAALRVFPELWLSRTLIFANDSVYGPVRQSDLAACVERMRASDSDFVALTESWQVTHHVQSYFFGFTKRGLSLSSVKKFWLDVRSNQNKEAVIYNYEVAMLRTFREAGLTTEILFPTGEKENWINPTLMKWRELLENGYPFIKVQLLRDRLDFTNSTGWEEYLRDNLPLLGLIKAHLGALASHAANEIARSELQGRPG